MAKISGFHCLLDKFKHRQFMGDTRNPESVVCPRTHPTSASLLSQPYYLVSILWIKVQLLFPLSLLLSSRLKEQSGYAVRDFE